VSRHLRAIADPFVVAPPAGARVRTRLVVSPEDEAVLDAVGVHLGRLAGADLLARCAQGRLDAAGRAVSRRQRKQAMTGSCSSRWAGAITRTSEDSWGLAERNLQAQARSLRARIGRIGHRLVVAAGEGTGKTRGYGSQAERWEKQRRLQALQARLADVETRLAEGRVSICRGGRRLARGRHNLAAAGLDERAWRQRWESARFFLTADGEADKNLGNETIRWHPGQSWAEVKLPRPLAHLANRPRGRYRIEKVHFGYRGDDVAGQAESGALRYDISYDPGKRRWYLDASWTTRPRSLPALDDLRAGRVLAADLNAGHLAAWVLDPSGNPVGQPHTIPLELAGLGTATRDGRLRAAISTLLAIARASGCAAIVIEDLNFSQARGEGRERSGRRPSRGRRGRWFRQMVAGIPAARFRDRLAQMASNTGLAVVAVDPAYTSRWGAQHWLGAIQQISAAATGHHAAAVVIGRRALGQRARRRERRDSTRPEDRQERAANSAVQTAPATAGLPQAPDRKPRDRKARGQPQPQLRQRTRPAERASPGDQATQDRSGPPEAAMSNSLPR
jgi:IS605 OrfB family transposase